MGIFDIIELRNHISSINEYCLAIDSSCMKSDFIFRTEITSMTSLIEGHLISMKKILDKLEK